MPDSTILAALSGLRLLPRGRLPGWRVDLDTRVLLCDMDPAAPLRTRLDMLRVWSALLGVPIGYDRHSNRYLAGYLHVKVTRSGVDARVRAFITHAEAESAEVLDVLHGQEENHDG
ncbi:hypothetical protein [Streptosporangium sp. OZ121]|uniref:hypothetical protein n=1 Tax=Streptosporangium sp. OZ121 TaxID=3444183 RepID=UPI003F79ABDC